MEPRKYEHLTDMANGIKVPVRPAPEFKPYQLKPKRSTNVEPFLEPPMMEPPEEQPTDPKKLKRMKKKLDELNRKIRHSRKKHDGLIHKQNSLRKAIEELKWGNAKQPTVEPAQGFVEHERAFGRAYSSYRANGRPRMDVDTFFSCIRGELISLITRERTDLNSVRDKQPHGLGLRRMMIELSLHLTVG